MPKRAEVDAWFRSYDNPMKAVVLRVREIILAADPRMDECIKWQTPTFTFHGNLASFNPKSKQHASLLFHTGAQIPGRHPRLEGRGSTARTMKMTSLADAESTRRDLEAIVRAWCELKANAASTRQRKDAPAKAGDKGPAKRVSKIAAVGKASKRALTKRGSGASR